MLDATSCCPASGIFYERELSAKNKPMSQTSWQSSFGNFFSSCFPMATRSIILTVLLASILLGVSAKFIESPDDTNLKWTISLSCIKKVCALQHLAGPFRPHSMVAPLDIPRLPDDNSSTNMFVLGFLFVLSKGNN